MGKKNFGKNQQQVTNIKRLKARGFGHISETATGVALGLVDSKGLMYKVVVNKHGKIRRYRATKATTFERQTLPRLEEPFEILSNGNMR